MVEADNSGWISVRDALPPYNVEVFYKQPNGLLCVDYGINVSEMNCRKWKPLDWIDCDD